MAKRDPEPLKGSEKPKVAIERGTTLDLRSFEKFRAHPLVAPLSHRYHQDAVVAHYAVRTLVEELEALNREFRAQHGRTAFTTVEGRVKSENSFLLKLYRLCRETSDSRGITQQSLNDVYASIKDLGGVRFSCPYFDEVKPAIDNHVRPWLKEHGHASDLHANSGFEDKDLLDVGDQFGYRSYHFFVNVATAIDVFGARQPVLCEVQARTELQHVWAVKSHDLLYKPETGWTFSDKHVVEDMRQVSNNLRAADQHLVSIRDRIIRGPS